MNFGKFFVVNVEEKFSRITSSIGKWGGQLKITKREIRDYMILEL